MEKKTESENGQNIITGCEMPVGSLHERREVRSDLRHIGSRYDAERER